MSKKPLLDIRNPCYSSTVSASSFLRDVSGSIVGPPASRDQYLLSFIARLVYPPRGITEDIIGSSGLLFSSHSLTQEFLHSGAPPSDDFVPVSPTMGIHRRSFQSLSMPLPHVPAKRSASLLNNNGDSRPYSSLVLGLSLGERKYAPLSSQSSTFSDLCGSSKRMRSSMTFDQSSYEVEKADPFVNLAHLNRSCSEKSLSDAIDVTGVVSPSNSVNSSFVRGGSTPTPGYIAIPRSSSQLLGLLTKELASKGFQSETKPSGFDGFQRAVDMLAEGGLLTARVLELLSQSPIRRLNLRSSLTGLNPYKLDDVLQMFRKIDNFRALSILVLEDVLLTDDGLLCIHHLPSLEELNLNCTGVCDTGVFYLVALRHTLTTLMLRGNKSVTDNAISALLLLSRLRTLGLRGTSITMAGLHRLMPFSDNLYLHVPAGCEAYLDTLHTQYLLSPLPPLITRPEEASTLDLAALKRNLSAHAAYNSTIISTGNKSGLCAQLIALLERRRGDLAVREMMWRSREMENSLGLPGPPEALESPVTSEIRW